MRRVSVLPLHKQANKLKPNSFKAITKTIFGTYGGTITQSRQSN